MTRAKNELTPTNVTAAVVIYGENTRRICGGFWTNRPLEVTDTSDPDNGETLA